MILLMVAVLFSMTATVLAQRSQVWWSGGTSSDVSNVANWVTSTGSAAPALGGSSADGLTYDIVRIGTSAGGTGGYEVFLHNTQPVLSTTYPSPDGNSFGGWWFVLNNNILTLENGAYLVMNRENNALRNGGKLIIKGRSNELTPSGPSLIMAGNFRLSANGSVTEAAADTCKLIVSDSGYVQVDPSLKTTAAAAFIMGTSDAPGTMPRGELIIENNGRVEVLQGILDMYLQFMNADPSVNQIIIRDKGELSLYGDLSIMGMVGTTPTSLQDLISTGLITNDQGGTIEATGTNPTVIKVTGLTGVKDKGNAIPMTYALKQNYPNPFNPSTMISFQLAKSGYTTLKVYDLLGKEVATLVDGNKSAGLYNENFDGSKLVSGVYFAKLQTASFTQTIKLILEK